jgi:hypothetical protein
VCAEFAAGVERIVFAASESGPDGWAGMRRASAGLSAHDQGLVVVAAVSLRVAGNPRYQPVVQVLQ